MQTIYQESEVGREVGIVEEGGDFLDGTGEATRGEKGWEETEFDGAG